jgi:predicted nucleic acid-binding protein
VVIVIDTNIFLEYLLGQEKAEACLLAIEKLIDTGEEAFISSFSLHSIEVILVRKNLIKELDTFLNTLAGLQLIRVYYTTVKEEKEVLEVMSKTGLDFDDSIQYHLARKLNADLLTLDKHFDNVKGVKVIRP